MFKVKEAPHPNEKVCFNCKSWHSIYKPFIHEILGEKPVICKMGFCHIDNEEDGIEKQSSETCDQFENRSENSGESKCS